MPSNHWTLCVPCRKAWRGAPTCKHETIWAPRNYRVPKKRNDKAWKMIANGDLYWEHGRWGAPDHSRFLESKKQRDARLTSWYRMVSRWSPRSRRDIEISQRVHGQV